MFFDCFFLLSVHYFGDLGFIMYLFCTCEIFSLRIDLSKLMCREILSFSWLLRVWRVLMKHGVKMRDLWSSTILSVYLVS